MRVSPNITEMWCEKCMDEWCGKRRAYERGTEPEMPQKIEMTEYGMGVWRTTEEEMLTSDVKESCAGEDVTDLFVFMQMPISYRVERKMSIALPGRAVAKQIKISDQATHSSKNVFSLLSYESPNPSLVTLIVSLFL